MTESDSDTFAYRPVPEIVSQLGLCATGAGTDGVGVGADNPQQDHPELYDLIWNSGRILPEYQLVFVSVCSLR